jgi:hypothetical protein
MTERRLRRYCAVLSAGLLAGAAHAAEPLAAATTEEQPAATSEPACDSATAHLACLPLALAIENAPGLPDDVVPHAHESSSPLDVFDFALSPVPPDASAPPAPFKSIDLSAELSDLPFRDQEPFVNRLRDIRALPFLTLWNSTGATLYVGIDRKGNPGLHLRQKGRDESAPVLSDSDDAPQAQPSQSQPGATRPANTPARAKPLSATQR